MKKLTFLLLALFASLNILAYDFSVQNSEGKTIYYEINSDGTSVSVTHNGNPYSGNAYSGSIVIPQSVNYNGKSYSVTSLGKECFSYCKSLTSVEIPSLVTSLGEYSFSHCESLTTINLPNAISSIGKNCFSYCSSLTSIEIPGLVETISPYTFYECSNLQSVNIGNGVKEIGLQAFVYSGLKNIDIPSSVKSIQGYAFMYCNQLESFTLPNEIEHFGPYVFAGTKWEKGIRDIYGPLNEIYIGNEDYILYYIDGKGLDSEKKVEIKEGTKIIAGNCIRDKEYLEELTIPNSVTSIGAIAFGGNKNLKKVVIGNGLNAIYGELFWNCPNLSEITTNATTPPQYFGNPWALYHNMEDKGIVEESVKESCTLFVPRGSKILYEATYPWSEFKNIEEFGEDYSYSLDIPNSDLRRGQVNILPVKMVNEGEVVSFQCDLSLPEGLSLEKNGDSYNVRKTDRTSEFVFSTSDVEGKIRILGFSPSNTSITGNEGAIFTLPINVSEDVALGSNVTISISNILITKKDGFEEVEAPTVASVHKIIKGYGLGDVNDDGKISVADISMAVEYVMGHTPANSIKEAADMNEDGKISAADISIIVSYIMSGNTTPSYHIAPKNNNTNGSDYAILSIDGNKLSVGVSNGNAYTAAQFDVDLPDGISLTSIEMPNASTDHIATYSMLNDHSARVLIFSPTNEQFPFGESLINLSLTSTSANAAELIGVDNILLAAKEGSDIVEYQATGDNCYAEVSGISDMIANGKLTVKTKNGNIIITSDRDTTVTITTVSGQTQTETIHAGENLIPATPGIYFVNGKKIILN